MECGQPPGDAATVVCADFDRKTAALERKIRAIKSRIDTLAPLYPGVEGLKERARVAVMYGRL